MIYTELKHVSGGIFPPWVSGSSSLWQQRSHVPFCPEFLTRWFAQVHTPLHKVGKLHLGKAHPVLNILSSHCRQHLAQLTAGTALPLQGEGRKSTGGTMPSLIQQSHGKHWSRAVGIYGLTHTNRGILFLTREVKQWRAGCWWPVLVNKALLSSLWN